MSSIFLPDEHPFAGLRRNGYDCIVVDIPWSFKVYSRKGEGRSALRHYKVMTLKDVKALPIADLAKPNTHLMMWCTAPNLEQGFAVGKTWGFEYSSRFIEWVKLRKNTSPIYWHHDDFSVGMGFTTRKNSEPCLLFTKGNPKRHDKSVRELLITARREHSRKPDEFRHRVDKYVGPDAKVCELFARSTFPGWDYWGDQATKFDAVAA